VKTKGARRRTPRARAAAPAAHEVHGAEARRYWRRWVRNEVNLPARVEIRLEDGEPFTEGTAIVRDISLKGARLGRIVLKKRCLPARTFKVAITFKREDYEGIGAVGRPVRFGAGPEFELAVAFDDNADAKRRVR
jgi:hypothetical protein